MAYNALQLPWQLLPCPANTTTQNKLPVDALAKKDALTHMALELDRASAASATVSTSSLMLRACSSSSKWQARHDWLELLQQAAIVGR
jgi:hypothetical protein